MSYPAAPWHLQGFSLQTLHLLDTERVRPFIPDHLQIFSVLPGKTLGGVYIASYGKGSTLEYNELIVVSGLVQQVGQMGAWISHIYVDHPDSVAGGRKIWGLPKQIAEFTWDRDQASFVQVRQGGRTLCTLRSGWQLPGWQQPVALASFGILNANLLSFIGRGTMHVQLASLNLTVSPDSPFAELNLGHPLLGFYSRSLDLMIDVPSIVDTINPVYI
jgi:hypothetical protein